MAREVIRYKDESAPPVNQLTTPRFRLELDFVPPSTNGLFTQVGKRRIPSRAYVHFKLQFQTACLFKAKERLPAATPFAVTLRLNINRRRDIDNCAKAILDGLVQNSLTPDDHFCDRLTIIRDCTVKGVVIEAEAL